MARKDDSFNLQDLDLKNRWLGKFLNRVQHLVDSVFETEQGMTRAEARTNLGAAEDDEFQSHKTSTSNPHSVTKTQVSLGNVTNDAQLKIASNLSDVNSASTSRTNLGLGTAAVANTGTSPTQVPTNADLRVSNLTALKALSAPSGDQTVWMLGRSSVADGGERQFTWISGDQSANVTADPQSGVWVPPDSDATGASGAWKSQATILTAQHFGALGVNFATDDIVGLQAFFDYFAGSAEPIRASCQGRFEISAKLTIGNGAEFASKHMEFDAIIRSASAFTSQEELVLWDTMHRVQCDGTLRIEAGTGFDLADRNHWYCMKSIGGGRATYPQLVFLYAIRFGWFINSIGNQNLCDVPLVSPSQVGYATRKTVSAFTNSGSAGSTNQRTELTLDAVPSTLYAEARDGAEYIIHNDHPYAVMGVALPNNTITVYPWVLDVGVTDTVDVLVGGGILHIGSDSNLWRFGHIDCSNTPHGYAHQPLYGAIIDQFHYNRGDTDANSEGFDEGIAFSNGRPTGAATRGGSIGLFYAESGSANRQYIQATSDIAAMSIDAGGGGAFSKDGLIRLGPWQDQTSPTYTTHIMDAVIQNELGASWGNGGGRPRSNVSSSIAAPLKPSKIPFYTQRANTATVQLQYNDDANRLWGFSTVFVLAQGGRANGGFDDWTFTADQGWTVNGVTGTTGVTFSDSTGQTLFLCSVNYASTDWDVTPIMPWAEEAAIADLTVTGTAEDSVARQGVNDILAVLRTHKLIDP